MVRPENVKPFIKKIICSQHDNKWGTAENKTVPDIITRLFMTWLEKMLKGMTWEALKKDTCSHTS